MGLPEAGGLRSPMRSAQSHRKPDKSEPRVSGRHHIECKSSLGLSGHGGHTGVGISVFQMARRTASFHRLALPLCRCLLEKGCC